MTPVSVVIPTFNRARKVRRAISSVLSQTHNHYEIIVVDDGSSDGTGSSLAPFGDRIEYRAHSANAGVSAARNSGIKAARYPLVTFLDSDDYWLPEKLAVQVRFHEENPDAVASQTDEIWIRRGRRVNPGRRHRKPSGDIFVPSLKLCLVSASAVMIRRPLCDEVGLFDESLPACEDYDLWLRIACRHPIHLIERPLVVKEGGGRDQLSATHKGMDRFRIKAMLKILGSGWLTEEQAEATVRELALKCRIYGNGCLKRGKRGEGEYYLSLPEAARETVKLDFGHGATYPAMESLARK
jgi:glycosyltransferase involved in cell wall biosynthesis